MPLSPEMLLKVEGARAILRALALEGEKQCSPGISVILIKQLALSSDELLENLMDDKKV